MNFSFGANPQKTTAGLQFGLTTNTPTSSVGFSLAGGGDAAKTTTTTTSTAVIGLSLSQNKPIGTNTLTTNSSGTTVAATTVTGFSLGAPIATATTSILNMATTAVPTSAVPAVPAPLLGTAATTVVSSASSASAPTMNFCQLEEAINKWTLDLEEQEKLFMNQVHSVKSWDKLLINNGQKIVKLNNAVEEVKLEQQQLDHELDFILAQQRELEECLLPLEKELSNTTTTDLEREQTYELAEHLDTQLKQMNEDLKEIIEHVNETNKRQDPNDPVVQIGKILNAHMNSLQWIDHNIAHIESHLDQIGKLHDVQKRDHERILHLTYE